MHLNNHYNKSLRKFATELRTETVSRAEKYLWKAGLSRKQTGQKFLRQRPIHNFIVDFFAPEIGLIIEVDGSSHFVKGGYDEFRENKLRSLGYELLRFKEGDVLQNVDGVIQKVRHTIHCLEESKLKSGHPPRSSFKGG